MLISAVFAGKVGCFGQPVFHVIFHVPRAAAQLILEIWRAIIMLLLLVRSSIYVYTAN